MNGRDDYIKSERTERKLGLPVQGEPDSNRLTMTPEEVLEAGARLERLDWGHGLTRDEIRLRCRELPLGIYLRLPDSKRFHSPVEALHEAGVAPSRSEGDFLGANPNIPDAEEDGGPPAWGGGSSFFPRTPPPTVASGSASDTDISTESTLPDATRGREPASGS